ncbi:hypothetical protein QTG54_001350 [Skeletonema marinoi]|uniref:Uncharacterized protein n=1 Tax=Skeletonema marinoi TaxID=267567 RepID=A0AAD9DHI2_9STRA|nr:hypothetical protein QTG54_001350 [Skeletonema marinoi]
MFKLLHGGGGSGAGRRRDVFKAFEKKLQEDRAAKGQPHEINTDSGGFFSRLRGSKYMIPES